MNTFFLPSHPLFFQSQTTENKNWFWCCFFDNLVQNIQWFYSHLSLFDTSKICQSSKLLSLDICVVFSASCLFGHAGSWFCTTLFPPLRASPNTALCFQSQRLRTWWTASLNRTAGALSWRSLWRLWGPASSGALVKGEGWEIALALVQLPHDSHTCIRSVAREPEMDTSQDYCRYTVLYLNGLLYV